MQVNASRGTNGGFTAMKPSSTNGRGGQQNKISPRVSRMTAQQQQQRGNGF
jgi:hypothetical protein